MGDAKKDSLTKRKLDWSLLMIDCRPALKYVAKVLHYASYEKENPYGPRNWMKGFGDEKFKTELRSAIERHTDAIDSGEMIDEESKLPHFAHILCGWIFLFMYWIMAKDGE